VNRITLNIAAAAFFAVAGGCQSPQVASVRVTCKLPAAPSGVGESLAAFASAAEDDRRTEFAAEVRFR